VGVADDSTAFFTRDLDVVVEAAGHAAVAEYGCQTLDRGRDFCLLSVGALANEQMSGWPGAIWLRRIVLRLVFVSR
jgi:predicted dinucleotide-utilizing enzyme